VLVPSTAASKTLYLVILRLPPVSIGATQVIFRLPPLGVVTSWAKLRTAVGGVGAVVLASK
jgi:hypothetical protein